MAPTPFDRWKLSPRETRILFKAKGWRTVVGFQTRNTPHIGHEYVQKAALTFTDGIFINPVIGKKKKGDFKDEVILASYEELIRHYYLKERAVMAILQMEMRYAGPREAIHHAIIRKNFGCTHIIIGRDHAGVGKYYHPFAAQDIFEEFPDLGIVPLFFRSFYFCRKCGSVVNEKICPHPTVRTDPVQRDEDPRPAGPGHRPAGRADAARGGQGHHGVQGTLQRVRHGHEQDQSPRRRPGLRHRPRSSSTTATSSPS